MAKNNTIWTKGHKLERFDIIPVDQGGDFLNMIGQYGFIKYYEDVIDPAVHVEITCVDTNGFLNKLPIRSGYPVNLKLTHPSQDEALEYDIKGEPLVITNISNHLADNKREMYTLTCETKHAISNQTTRVWEKHTGSIESTVRDILEKKLQVKSDRIKKIDSTKNNYEFYGNYRRPFKVISDMCPKAIPPSVSGDSPESGSSGFLFFETQDGWNFRSIDAIFREGQKNKKKLPKYDMTAYKDAFDIKNNFMIAAEPIWDESHDILKKLRSGAYKTANWYYDVLSRKVHFHTYQYEKSVDKNMEKANEEEVIPSDFTQSYSRIILSTLDHGTTTPDSSGSDTLTPQDQARYQAQASARYAAMFSQTLDITVPMNISLRAGDMINVEFPEINTEKPFRGRNSESGLYMIARLSHEFGNPDGDFTGLSLVRDTFQSNK